MIAADSDGFDNALITFSGPISALDFTPAWFVNEDSGGVGILITPATGNRITVTFDIAPVDGDIIDLVNQPPYVIPGQSITFSA